MPPRNWNVAGRLFLAIIGVATTGWIVPAGRLFASDPPTRLPSNDLMVYRGADGKPAPVKTVDDWKKRRTEIIAGMAAIMGKLPGAEKRCDFDVKVEEEVDGGSFVRRRITYASEPNSRTPAYLLIPKTCLGATPKPAPAVLCLHGTNNIVGHGVVVGLGESKQGGYANDLADRGYVVLAPNYPLLAKYQPDLKALGWESGTLKSVWDNMRGLDYLATLPFVKKDGFGTIGHSLGGHNSVFTAVIDERIKVVVTSCGLDSFQDYYDGNPKNWKPEKGWTQTRYMPRLAAYDGKLDQIPFDFYELIGALAPRDVLIVAPLQDSNFRHASVDKIASAARKIFDLHGVSDHLRVTHPDCDHRFPSEERERAFQLFDVVLKD